MLDKLTYAGNLANLAGREHPRLKFVQGDICDAELVDKLMAEARRRSSTSPPSPTSTARSTAPPTSSAPTCVGTQVLLDAALRYGVGRFVHVSTDEVYGSIDDRLLARGPPAGPQLALLGVEGVLRTCSPSPTTAPTAWTCGSPAAPTTTGRTSSPRRSSRCSSPTCWTARRSRCTATACNVRDWLHVDDHCQGVDLVRTGGRPGEVYNIGGGTELTNKELTGLLLEACGAGWDSVEYVEDRKGHDLRYSVDWGKLHDELGYTPRHDFAAGLAATVAWYRDNRAWWEPLKRRVGADEKQAKE